MKNRNKRITSVLAASMALGTFAPVIASVAPVFAISGVPSSNVDSKYNGTYVSEDGNTTWYVKANDNLTDYNATLISLNSAKITNLTLGERVQLIGDAPNNADVDGTALDAKVSGIGYDSQVVGNSQNLSTITIKGSDVTINYLAFNAIQALDSADLSGVTSIGGYAFGNCSSLGTVVFGDGLTDIGKSAFQNTGLYTVEIPNSVKTIGKDAFKGTELKGEIALPSSLKSIGEGSFATKNNALTLVYPQTDGENSTFPITWPTTSVFGADNLDIRNFNIKGSGSLPTSLTGKDDAGYYLAAPDITLNVGGQTVKNKDNVQVILGQNVKITATVANSKYVAKSTLTIDGTPVKAYVNNGQYTYTLKTPQLGTHTITFTDGLGVSRTVTINVVNDQTNYWINENFNVPEWHLGADVTPSGAVAKLGEVVYVYSKTENGVYYTNKPNSEGTWWVKAVVYGNNNQIDLSTAPQSFTVLAPLAKQGWENTAAGWTYYVDGEQVKSELITVDGRKYLIGDNGIMVKGWAKNDQTGNEWMFFDNYGCQKTGWLSNDGRWYFFNEDGVMQANEWVTDKGKSYFLTQSGGMAASRWLKKDGHDVYVDNSGALKTGWLFDSNYMAWYYLEPDTGYMATSGTVDGWTIQANGQAVQK